jgi:hypothetical protein
MNTLAYDTQHIYEEHRETFALLRDTIDLSQVAFVGGIADYLNLRGRQEMPINDFDLIISNPSVIAPLKNKLRFTQTETLYLDESSAVFQANNNVNNCYVHLDFFVVTSIYEHSLITSNFLGTAVRHHDFETMRKFHNNQIPVFNSVVKGIEYDWKRLYKHSSKAGLYNLLSYKNDQTLLTKI